MTCYVEVDLPETAAGLRHTLAWAVDQWRDSSPGSVGERLFLSLAGDVATRLVMARHAEMKEGGKGEGHAKD